MEHPTLNLKRLSAIALYEAIVLSVVLFAGCGGGGSNEGVSAANAPASQAAGNLEAVALMPAAPVGTAAQPLGSLPEYDTGAFMSAGRWDFESADGSITCVLTVDAGGNVTGPCAAPQGGSISSPVQGMASVAGTFSTDGSALVRLANSTVIVGAGLSVVVLEYVDIGVVLDSKSARPTAGIAQFNHYKLNSGGTGFDKASGQMTVTYLGA